MQFHERCSIKCPTKLYIYWISPPSYKRIFLEQSVLLQKSELYTIRDQSNQKICDFTIGKGLCDIGKI